MSTPCEGLTVTLDGEPFPHVTYSQGQCIAVLFSGGEKPLAGRVTNLPKTVGGKKTSGATMTIEIPNYLPEDIDEWLQKNGHAVVKGDNGNPWEAEARKAGKTKTTKLTSEEEARFRRITLADQLEMARAYGALFRKEYVDEHGGAGKGAYLGGRDRGFINLIFEQGTLTVFSMIFTRSVMKWDLRFEGDCRGGVLGELGVSFAGRPTTKDWPGESFWKQLERAETPCSGIWRHANGLFPWGTSSQETFEAKAVLRHAIQQLKSYDILEARSPWPDFQGDVFTHADIQEGKSGELFQVAMEAFLYARRDYLESVVDSDLRALEVDKASSSVSSKRGELQQEEDEQITHESDAKPELRLRDDFAEAASALRSRLIPQVTDHDIAQLEALIRGAQQNPPNDRHRFVADINRMLDVHRLRVDVGGEELARLRVVNNSIQFSLARGGSRGFRKADIRVVRVPENYVQRGVGSPEP